MRKLAFVFALLILAISVNTALGLPGSGTQEDPWRIESPVDFNEFATDPNYWDDHTRLETDVNLAGQTYSTAVIAPDTNNSNWGFDGPAFTGVFDGNGCKIIALTIDDEGAGNDYLGLFGYIDGGEVRNLGLDGGSISGEDCVGGLIGGNDGSISNCYSTGDVSGVQCVGGLVGENPGGVSNCYSTGSVSGKYGVGGLVGVNWYGILSNCHSTGSVSGNGWVGGLVGENYHGSVSNCNSTGDVSGDDYVGGLVGENYGSVSNCYSTGSVSGDDRVGGLVGVNWYGILSNCYSTGEVSGVRSVGGLMGFNFGSVSSVSNCYSSGSVSGDDRVGGLVGWNYGGVSNCYSTGSVSGDDRVGGLVGWNYRGIVRYGIVSNCFWDTETQTHGVTESIGRNDGTVTNVEGLPTAEMQDANTFIDAGWDFTTPIWKFCSVPNYPSLWWEECPEPVDLIAELLEEVGELGLQGGLENSLMAKLEAALGALEDENENNDAAAVNTLEAFINAVEAQRGNKISEADADALIAAAQEIIAMLSTEVGRSKEL